MPPGCVPARCPRRRTPRTPPRRRGPPPSGRSARRTCCTRRRRSPRGPGWSRSCRPRFPEVVVEAPALVNAAERELERHVDLDPLGLAVGELAVETPAPVEVDDRVRGRRVGAVEQIVVREREEPAAPRELDVLETAGVRALDADAVLRELHGPALRALPAVEREELLPVTIRDDRGRDVGRPAVLPDELPEARVSPVRRERPLHLDLAVDARPRDRRRR